MQEKVAESVSDENTIRVLNTKGLLSHHDHLKRFPGTLSARCRICTVGMGGIITTFEKKVIEPVDSVDEGDRGDKEGDAAPASGSRWDRRED